MQLWKSMADLLVSKKLTLGKNAQVVAFNSSGVEVPVALGAVEARSAASTLSQYDNGKTILLNRPRHLQPRASPFMGGRFKFIVTGIPGASNHQIVAPASNQFKGSVSSADLANASAAASTTAATNINLTTTAYVGDWVEVVSNGVNWLVSGSVKAQGGLTFS
jgi:hypothetical protein